MAMATLLPRQTGCSSVVNFTVLRVPLFLLAGPFVVRGQRPGRETLKIISDIFIGRCGEKNLHPRGKSFAANELQLKISLWSAVFLLCERRICRAAFEGFYAIGTKRLRRLAMTMHKLQLQESNQRVTQ